MKYLIDYLEDNKESFLQRDFDVIDAMVLSHFSYLKLQKIKLKRNGFIKIGEIPTELSEKLVTGSTFPDEDKKIFLATIKSKRYSSLKIVDITSIEKKEDKDNFFAYTVEIDDNKMAIIYRGTDTSFKSWEESLSMSYEPLIDGQNKAKLYLEKISKLFDKKIYLCGHSKGGNLAVYAGSTVSSSIQEKIIKIYDLDGPGFFENFYKNEDYKDISLKVEKYIPQKSVVGLLLESRGSVHIVESTGLINRQHLLNYWAIENNSLRFVNESKFISKATISAIDKWMLKYTTEERKEIVSILFQILGNSGIEGFDELFKNLVKSYQLINQAIKSMDEEKQEFITKAFDDFVDISKEEIVNTILNK